MSKTILPNFFIIGAAKSGTTSLHNYLAQHPEIFMSQVKEPNFFSFMNQKPRYSGPKIHLQTVFTSDRLRREKYGFSITTWDDYTKLFRKVHKEKAIGESSVSYLYFKEAAMRIKQFIPKAKLIAVLRNPVDRAYSKFLQFKRDEVEPFEDFEKAFEAESERISFNWSPTWHYKSRGFYYRQLKYFYDLFDKNQIKIYLYEDFFNYPRSVLCDIFRFLEVNYYFEPDISFRHNVSHNKIIPRSRYLYYFFSKSWFAYTIKRYISNKLLDRLRPMVLTCVAKQAQKKPAVPMSQEIKNRLIDEFRNDIQCLEKLISRDLSSWLKP